MARTKSGNPHRVTVSCTLAPSEAQLLDLVCKTMRIPGRDATRSDVLRAAFFFYCADVARELRKLELSPEDAAKLKEIAAEYARRGAK
jgi:hypothetical protein